MKTTTLVFLLLLSGRLLAQTMSRSEYRDYLARVSEVIPKCQKRLDTVNPERMRVSFAVGKQIEQMKQAVTEELSLLRGFVSDARVNEKLSNDILIEESLGDISQTLTQLSFIIGQDSSGLADAIDEQASDLINLQTPFRKHIFAYAEMLEAKASAH